MNRWAILPGSLVAFVLVAPAAGQEALGPPFQVNTFTTNQQLAPAVSPDAGGGFVVAWQSQTQDGFDNAVIARGFQANGTARTSEVLANTVVVGPQFEPAVAAVPDGGFFVAWTDGFIPGENVFLRRFLANGLPLTVELPVNTTIFGTQQAPSLDTDAQGNVVVVWESQNDVFSPNFTILARRYTAAGVPLTGELQVSQTTAGDQHRPVVGVDPQGNFVVAWQALGRDGSGNAILARRFNAAGTALADEFVVNVHTTGDQTRPWVDRDAQGRFVVVWQSDGQDASSWGVYARRFSATGGSLGSEFRANTTTDWFQERPVVSMVPDGRFIIVWQSGSQDGPDYGVYGQQYDASGARVGNEFRINTVTAGHQYMPAVAAQPSGGFVVAWAQQESLQTTFTEVWARRYGPFGGGAGDLIFKDGFERGP
jgi:hypothetical protein